MLDGIADLEWKMVKNFVNYRFYCSPTLCKTRTLLDVPALLDFPPNATHKMCCDMPYLVAIDTIATKLFRGPWDAKGRIALGYCDVVHQEVAKVFLLQHNATLQLGFYLVCSGCKVYYCDASGVLLKVQLQRFCFVANCNIATH
jgi:hypothetical protein